jgi:hypothetical protein
MEKAVAWNSIFDVELFGSIQEVYIGVQTRNEMIILNA